MSILVDSRTRVICQGITGYRGTFFSHRSIEYGTRMVAGVVPGRGGQKHLNLPVFDTVAEARQATGASATVLFVPPNQAYNAVIEAIDAGIELIVCITEGIPILDMLRIKASLDRSGCRMIGPNCPGIIVPGQCNIGIMPSSIYQAGKIGVISRSGTLFYEAVTQLCDNALGQSTCIGIGADVIHGLSFAECLELFKDDSATEAVLIIGEIGGAAEEQAAQYLTQSDYTKPVIAYIAGRHAPRHRRMGHSGAIIANQLGGTERKIEALRKAGVILAQSPVHIGRTVREAVR